MIHASWCAVESEGGYGACDCSDELEISIVVRCRGMVPARDLANGIQEAIRRAKVKGQHVDVDVVQGPTIGPAR